MLVEAWPEEAIDKASKLWWRRKTLTFDEEEIETKKLGGSKKQLLKIKENKKTFQNQRNEKWFLKIEEKRENFLGKFDLERKEKKS